VSNIHLRFKIVREAFGYSQQTIADMLSIPQQNYARYETGATKKVPYSIVSRFADKLKVDQNWIETGKLNKKTSEAIRTIFSEWKNEAENLKENSGVPQEVFAAIMREQISPSNDLIKKIETLTGISEKWIVWGDVDDKDCSELIELRKKANVDYNKFAEEIGTSVDLLGSITNREVSPSTELIQRAVAYLERKYPGRIKGEKDTIGSVVQLKKEIECLQNERDWLRKQNDDLIQIIKSLKKGSQ